MCRRRPRVRSRGPCALLRWPSNDPPSSWTRSADDRMLFGHKHRRARKVDARVLMLDEAAAAGLALRGGAGGGKRVQAVEPQLSHAIVRLGAAAPAPQPFVQGRRERDHQGTSK